MKVERNKIIKFAEDYLKVGRFQDYCLNGLQVEGAPEVSRIVIGVSLSEKLIKEAVRRKAEMVLVHHGIFSSSVGTPPKFRGALKKRLKLLLENDLNLAGFHLPLDAHPLIGNNASIAKALGLARTEPFDIGFVGELKKEMTLKDFAALVGKKLEARPLLVDAGKRVKRVAVISGGASAYYAQAREMGADTYLTGELLEFVVREAEEAGINIVNAGHYNTEKLGIKNLGGLIAKKFKLKAEFVDIPCEV